LFREVGGILPSVEEVTLRELMHEITDFASNASTIFGTPLWVETGLRNKAMGGAFRVTAMLAREGTDPCGFLLGCGFRIPGFKAFFSPLPRTMSQYGSLSVLPEFMQDKKRITESLLSAVYKNYDFGFVITPPRYPFTPGRVPRTWTIIPRKSLSIDLLQEKDRIWSNVHGQARKGIKRALKNGISVDFVNSLDPLPAFFKMLMEVATRTDWSLSFGEAFLRDILSGFRSNSVIARALLEDEFVAGAILFYDSRTLYCHSFASSAKGRKLQAADLLQWSIINWGKERGLSSYDLLGGNIPRIAHFKRSFGATDIDYDTIAFSKHPFMSRFVRRALDALL
jgi:Acetyltransferase (GNAT) domain